MSRLVRVLPSLLLIGFLVVACTPSDAPDESTSSTAVIAVGTCTGTYPSYWQDPAPKFADMWTGQAMSNAPPEGWSGPVFELSDSFPRSLVDEAASQPWRNERFDALFDPGTSQDEKTTLAHDYSWAVMRYIQEGNIDSGDVVTDWTLCDNQVRSWYHMPFQTYDALSGREFIHGLTREAPVTFNIKTPDHPDGSLDYKGSMWAVGFFNPTAAYTLGTVWQADGTATPPADDIGFADGAVVGKLLFNTSTPEELPMLENMPAWEANLSDPTFCSCTPDDGVGKCTMVEESEQCGRSTEFWGPVRLLQFDIAIKDHRAPGTEWVFGTFVADGQRKADESNPWNRISPLGLMWGNDTPPSGELAHAFPDEPRENGFGEEVIFWDTVDMLNAVGGDVAARHPGHLGCNSRLNGPADNANSTCMSCHMTASVADSNIKTPPIIAQFGGITSECVTPDPSDPDKGLDAAGSAATVKNGIAFAQMDSIYFADTDAGAPINMTVQTADGPKNVLGDQPTYADGRKQWVSLDFSLQLSISLVQWAQYQEHRQNAAGERIHSATLPGR